MGKKILVICEGTKKEPEIFLHVKSLGLLPQDIEIVSYGTNIYKLYRELEQESQGYEDGWESLDIQLLLTERAETEEERSILQDAYTDILLIFDFDPQDSFFRNHPETCYEQFRRLLGFFSESTEHGKLYLSYPMIEALQHVSLTELRSQDSEQFLLRQFHAPELRKKEYKRRSEREGMADFSKYGKDDLIVLALWHLKKVWYIVHGEKKQERDLLIDNELVENLLECEYNSYVENKCGFVVSTSLFYLIETYPSYFGAK